MNSCNNYSKCYNIPDTPNNIIPNTPNNSNQKWSSNYSNNMNNLNNMNNMNNLNNMNNMNNMNNLNNLNNMNNMNNLNNQYGMNTKYQYWNYKKKYNLNNRYSAGVLPYTYDLSGNCLILLGRDNDGVWSDFGGKCELKDNYNEKYTASREFYEESLGSILSIEECINKINGGNQNKIISKTLNGSPYYMFVVYIDYYNYSEYFFKTSNFMKYHFINEKYQLNKIIEKNNIKWFNVESVMNASTVPLRNVFKKTLENCKEQLLYIIK